MCIEDSIIVSIDENDSIQVNPNDEQRFEELVLSEKVVRFKTSEGGSVQLGLDMDGESITFF